MNKLCIDERYCKGCMICVDFCPVHALQPAEGLNAKGYRLPREKDMARCQGCGICVLMCPDFAITIQEEESPTEKGGRRRVGNR